MGLHANILTRQEVICLLEDVLKSENLNDANIELTSGAEKGDGYMSCMTKATIKTNDKTLNFIIKCAPKSEELRKLMPLADIYLREIHFYDKVIPAFNKFQAERNISSPFNSFPKCYKTVNDENFECIVMENIRECGFQLWDRKVLMDKTHITHILKEYGKFHAISFAMQDQDMELYNSLTKNMEELFKQSVDIFIEELKLGVDNVMSIFSNKGEEEIYNKLVKFKDSDIINYFQFLSKKPNQYNAICHGDCWCNNMMFKYENESKVPTQMRLLDFQIQRFNSPVTDLSYLLYASAPAEIYNNLDHYLKIYYKSLSEHMQALGSDANKLYPFVELKKDWKLYCKMGYIMSLIIHKCALFESDEVVDMMDIAESGKKISDLFNKTTKNDNLSNERLRNLTLHMFNNGYM